MGVRTRATSTKNLPVSNRLLPQYTGSYLRAIKLNSMAFHGYVFLQTYRLEVNMPAGGNLG